MGDTWVICELTCGESRFVGNCDNTFSKEEYMRGGSGTIIPHNTEYIEPPFGSLVHG